METKVKTGRWNWALCQKTPLGHSIKLGGQGIEAFMVVQVAFEEGDKGKITSQIVAVRQPDDQHIVVNTMSGSEYQFSVAEEKDSKFCLEDIRQMLEISNWWANLPDAVHTALYDSDSQAECDRLKEMAGYPSWAEEKVN